MLNEHQICLFNQIQTSQTGGQPYSITRVFSEECSEYSVTIFGDLLDFGQLFKAIGNN